LLRRLPEAPHRLNLSCGSIANTYSNLTPYSHRSKLQAPVRDQPGSQQRIVARPTVRYKL